MAKTPSKSTTKKATKSRTGRETKVNNTAATDDVVQIEQREKGDRRQGERRSEEQPVAAERRTAPRRKVQRRRQIDPTTCERDYSDQEIEFMHAIDHFKRTTGRSFPTCQDVLDVITRLGYQKA